MLLIFNLWAVILGFVILIIWAFFLNHFPELMSGPREPLVFGIITTVVGAIGELTGIKGRAFLLPVWLIGALVVGFQIGWIGVVAVLAFACVLFVVLLKRAKKREQIEWAAAKSAMAQFNQQAMQTCKQLWAWADKVLFLPVALDFNAEICAHNLEVLQKLQAKPAELSADEVKTLAQFQEFLKTNQKSPSPKHLDSTLRAKVRKLLQSQQQDRPSGAGTKSASGPLKTPPPIIPARLQSSGSMKFTPQNSLEEAVYGLKFGGMLREDVIAMLLEAQLFVLQNSLAYQPKPSLFEIVDSQKAANSWAGAFTSLPRIASCVRLDSATRFPAQVSMLALVGRIPKETGIIINPGWDFDLRITPQEIDHWINTHRHQSGGLASIYYHANRNLPLSEDEKSQINRIMEDYAVEDQIERLDGKGRELNWESFDLEIEPGQNGVILNGATRLPGNIKGAEVAGAEHWCAALSEIRRIVHGAVWDVRIEDHEIHWDEKRQAWDPFR